ncbi:MAG: DUF1573 domain-containing protein [Chitinophagales bacterium]|nr:DUF1573 domain-containing protein [Chitinophagales bacterium]
MKHALLLLIFFIIHTSAFSQTSSTKAVKTAAIDWVSDSHDFGIVMQNNPVQFQFEFVNKSNKPLVIANVKAGCSCTKVAFSPQPVLPFLRGGVTVTFLAHTSGIFSKSVTVIFDNKEKIVLNISGEVIQESLKDKKKK